LQPLDQPVRLVTEPDAPIDDTVDPALVQKNLNDISEIRDSPITKSKQRQVEDPNGTNHISANATSVP